MGLLEQLVLDLLHAQPRSYGVVQDDLGCGEGYLAKTNSLEPENMFSRVKFSVRMRDIPHNNFFSNWILLPEFGPANLDGILSPVVRQLVLHSLPVSIHLRTARENISADFRYLATAYSSGISLVVISNYLKHFAFCRNSRCLAA